MKVIDLAIGFSKGIIPPKIKYKGVEYEYSKTLKEYIKYESCENFNLYYKTLQINVEQFNDEVEIIEDTPNSIRKSIGLSPKEDKKINKKINWWLLEDTDNKKVLISEINLNFREIRDKIGEIIDYLKSKGE